MSILHYIGVDDGVTQLLCSYLTGRFQFVCYDGVCSDTLPVARGVPQGSIVGPSLFCIYISFIMRGIKFCTFHFYADDTQSFFQEQCSGFISTHHG